MAARVSGLRPDWTAVAGWQNPCHGLPSVQIGTLPRQAVEFGHNIEQTRHELVTIAVRLGQHVEMPGGMTEQARHVWTASSWQGVLSCWWCAS